MAERCIYADDFLDLFYVASAGQDKMFVKVVEQVVEDTPTADVVQVIRCKDCLYFEYKVGSYGTCKHWHTNSQDIFDLHFCGYAEPHIKRKR